MFKIFLIIYLSTKKKNLVDIYEGCGTFIATKYKRDRTRRYMMRITTSMYYKNLYGQSNSQLSQDLFDVNRQIASGLKIQYAKDDVSIFTETMRLDNEIASLGEVKASANNAYKITNQTDIVLNDFEDSMQRARTLLVQAANETNDDTSLDAIAAELRGLEDHLKNLANTSIDGKYLFSGTAVDTKPIDDNGVYQGNDGSLNAFLGSGVQQQYNLSGGELFFGEESTQKREITSNVVTYDLSKQYPDFTDPTVPGSTAGLQSSGTIRGLMGDSDNNVDTVNEKHFFYLRGTASDGTAFNEKFSMRDDESVDALLKKIGDAYGNTADNDVVEVTINSSGEIVVRDKMQGSSKLDFHMVAATDLSGGTAADVVNIDDLDSGESDFNKIINGTSVATNPNLHVKEFVSSPVDPASGTSVTNIDGILYDRTQFTKDGAKLSSSSPQVLKDGNAFATPSTKLSEVADLSQGTDGTLDGTQFTFSGTDIYGNAYDAQIDLKSAANGGSTFSLDGGVTNYNIYNMDPNSRSAVDADEMTYQQLMDVMNMVATGNIPTTNSDTDYDQAIYDSSFNASTYLSYDGRIQFEEINVTDTKATMALYDSNAGTFDGDASVMTFNTNNALTIRDPKTDFFKSLDEIITSVENHSIYPDSTGSDPRNVGIENSIAMMDDLLDHVYRSHASVGAQSNSLSRSIERTELLEISTMSLRSSVIDTDLAEASLELTQLNLNYEAMLSTVGKTSELSLVNYL